MSFGFCGCFRPTAQGAERTDYPTQARARSLRKERKELDLLDLNARRNLDLGLEHSPERSLHGGPQYDLNQLPESPNSRGS